MPKPSRTNQFRLTKPLPQEKYPQTLGKVNQQIEKFRDHVLQSISILSQCTCIQAKFGVLSQSAPAGHTT